MNRVTLKRDLKNEQLYANKLGPLGEMDVFPENYTIPKLNQEDSHNLHRPLTSHGIEVMTKNLTKVTSTSSVDGHLGSFHSLAIVDSAAKNILVHGPLRITTFVSFGQIPSSAIAGS